MISQSSRRQLDLSRNSRSQPLFAGDQIFLTIHEAGLYSQAIRSNYMVNSAITLPVSLRIPPIKVSLPENGAIHHLLDFIGTYLHLRKMNKKHNYPIFQCCPSVYFLLKYFSPDWCYSPPVGLHRDLSKPQERCSSSTSTSSIEGCTYLA